jgi:phosphonopyruvate decarboxylase
MDFIIDNFDLVTGVPCSYFKEFLLRLDIPEKESKIKHLIATREDEAIAIAAGAALSKKRSMVYMQNSGLGNIGDALTSLVQLYKLPTLILISYRGLEDDKDFPEHSIMGKINNSFLESLNLDYWDLEENSWKINLKKALAFMEEQTLPVVLLVKKGVLCQ